jgi:hypothetical protein
MTTLGTPALRPVESGAKEKFGRKVAKRKYRAAELH